MGRGLLITFEGIDGCGKTTQLKRAEAALRADGVAVEVTREPGGTAVGERIRDLVLSTDHSGMGVGCEALLYLAARAQHVSERIAPALAAGALVLCDRFCDATFAYQGFGRGVSLELLRSVNAFATGGLMPDLTFVFDISVELSQQRRRRERRKPDRMESGSSEFHQKMREGYLILASSQPGRIVLLPGERPVDELAAQVLAGIRRRLG